MKNDNIVSRKQWRLHRLRMAALAALVALVCAPNNAVSDRNTDPWKDVEQLTVLGRRLPVAARPSDDPLAFTPMPDTAELLRRLPGAAVAPNGPLTGIVAYRGSMGRRVRTEIDGIEIEPVGPNRMDSPLGYSAGVQVETLRLYRGIAPVSAGIETFAGAVSLETQTVGFGTDERLVINGKAGGGVSRSGSATSTDIMLGAAARSHRLQIAWSRERGGNIGFEGGTIRPSQHERETLLARAGWRGRAGELSLDYRRLHIGHTGTAALPMDILFVRSDVAKLGYSRSFGDTVVRAQLTASDSRHAMANVGLRPVPAPMMQRRSDPSGGLVGWRFEAAKSGGGGRFHAGVDGDYVSHDADVRNPTDEAFFVDAFNDVLRLRQGMFLEYKRRLTSGLLLDAGLRYAFVLTDAGRVDTSMKPPPVVQLRNRFNSSDRSRMDHHVDWVVSATLPVSSAFKLHLEAGRKTRSPSYQERYLWLPLEITGGLADGNNYVGTVGLRPEVAHEADVGLTWSAGPLLISPQAFYRRIDDYIQGVPATDPDVLAASAMTGDPSPLRFANVDAEMYGIDGYWALAVRRAWSLSGSVSFVRGRRRDNGDDLFRIAPPNGSIVLAYRRERWSGALESVLFAPQRNVSETNGERRSSGYALVNLRSAVRLSDGLELRAGVENLFDRLYRPHLAGINRVTASDVAVGERLPGPGRSAYLRLQANW